MTRLPSFGLPISYVLEFGPLMLVSTIASLVVIHATCTGYSLPAEYDMVVVHTSRPGCLRIRNSNGLLSR